MRPPTVLVTGVGAVIGYGIVRSLHRLESPPRILGMDINSEASGRHWCDGCVVACPASAAGYGDFIRETVATHGVDLIIPGIEQDMLRLSADRESLADCGAVLALNAPDLIETAADKWRTHLALTRARVPTIPTRIDGDFAELRDALGVPFLLKPRRSYASKGIQRIRDARDLAYWREQVGDQFMVQAIVGAADEEYTVGAFGYGDGTSSRQIAFRRRLSGEGATTAARVESPVGLEEAVSRLVRLFRPVGPTNFQFRTHGGAFLLLEINPRISSSTSLRAAFGFNEAAMCLDYYLRRTRPDCAEVRSGFAVRYIEDLVYYDRDPG